MPAEKSSQLESARVLDTPSYPFDARFTRALTLEKSVLTQFRFGFSFVNLGQYSALAVFFRRTRTTARSLMTFLVSYRRA